MEKKRFVIRIIRLCCFSLVGAVVGFCVGFFTSKTETIVETVTEYVPVIVEKTECEKCKEAELQEQQQPKKTSLGEFRLTAYCSCQKCCGKWALNRPKDENGNDIVYGASGERLYQGVSIAVDPKVIPYGSFVEFDGHTYTAHDCGGAIKGNRIDVYFESHEDALQFGAQYKEVFLIEKGE
jgi:3D (Asp-Asp-Asp) domain-containing protein